MKKFKNFQIQLYISAVFSLTLLSVACGILTNKTAREMFLKENPTYTIIYSSTGEGWDGVGYHHFEYKKPNDEKIYKEVWCFEQQEDGFWKVTSKYTPKD